MMRRKKRFTSAADVLDSAQQLARTSVDYWISSGIQPDEMRRWSKLLLVDLSTMLSSDISKFARTGKYPEYVED